MGVGDKWVIALIPLLIIACFDFLVVNDFVALMVDWIAFKEEGIKVLVATSFNATCPNINK